SSQPAARDARCGPQPVQGRIHDEVPRSGPVHLSSAESALEESDSVPRVARAGIGRSDAPQVVMPDAARARESHHRPLKRVAREALRLATLLAPGATEQVKGPIALDDDHARREQLALAPGLED